MTKDIGYVIVKYLDTSDALKDDDIVIDTERLQFNFGKHILSPKEIVGYENIPLREPITVNPEPCNEDWEDPVSDLEFGQQKINISNSSRFFLVEFYYVKNEVSN